MKKIISVLFLLLLPILIISSKTILKADAQAQGGYPCYCNGDLGSGSPTYPGQIGNGDCRLPTAAECPSAGPAPTCRNIYDTYSCTSAANSCGMTNNGTETEWYNTCDTSYTIYSNGCSASTPSNSACTPMTITTNVASSINANGATLSFTASAYNSVAAAGSIGLYAADGTTYINSYTTSPATVNANGTYTATLSSLTCATTYQFRGQADTTYGSKLSFTTSACPAMSVAWTNMPKTSYFGNNTTVAYSVTNIPSGQTATCTLYDYTGNTAISGVAAQTITPATLNVAVNGGVESAAIFSDAYQYTPTVITNWTFSPSGGGAGAGVVSNGNFGAANTAWGTTAPEGNQAIFVQNSGTYATYTNTLSAGTYTLNFKAANRTNSGWVQQINVTVDGSVVYNFTLPFSGTYAQKTTSFTIGSTGSHTISFVGLNAGDNTAFIDDMQLMFAGTSGSNAFTFNPSPSTLPVNPAGYGYVVKCTVPSPATTAQSAVGTVTVLADAAPTASLYSTNGAPTLLNYQCVNSTGVRLKRTGGIAQSQVAGTWTYASTSPASSTDYEYFTARFKRDAQVVIGATNTSNYYLDVTNNGSINGTDVSYINARQTTITVTDSAFATLSGTTNTGGGYGIAVGPDGYVYASNFANKTIERFDATTGALIGTFATIPGSPTGIVFANDGTGTLYVADYGSGKIKKVTTGGAVSNFVSVANPIGLALDSAGNLFVTQQTLNTVAKVTPAGVVTTFASGISNAQGIVITPGNDYMYVAAQTSGLIHQITPAGSVTTFASGFTQPTGLATDSTGNNFYVASLTTGNITKFNGSASSTVISGMANNPNSIAIGSTGIMYIGLYSGNGVRKTNVIDMYPQTFTGSFTPVQGAVYDLTCMGSYGTLPATTTMNAVNIKAEFLTSTSTYPTITQSCPTNVPNGNIVTSSITRSPAFVTTPIWANRTDTQVISAIDTDLIPSNATTTYTYTLSCLRNNGFLYTGQITTSLTVPPAVTVTKMNNPIVATGTSATVTWQSNGDRCDLQNWDGSATWATSTTGSVITGGYQYSYTMAPGNPYFTWLNSSHIGTASIGWRASCRDSANANKWSIPSNSDVQVYAPTRATISLPDINSQVNSDAVFKCTSDYDYVSIKKDGTMMASYPKTWNTNQTSSFLATINVAAGSTYELVCKTMAIPANIDQAIYPATGLQLSGVIAGNSSAAVASTAVTGTVVGQSLTITSTTTNGYFSNLSYDMSGATSWSVNFYNTSSGGSPLFTCTQAGGAGCTGIYSAFGLNSTNASVSLNNTSSIAGPYLSGARWVVSAAAGAVTKTLTIVMPNDSTPTGSLTPTLNPSYGSNAYNLTLRCTNAVSWQLVNTSFSVGAAGYAISSGADNPSGTGNVNVTVTGYSATNTNPVTTTAPIRLICTGASQTANIDVNIPIPSRTAASVSSFTVYPPNVVCGGGNVKVAWTVNNSVGKVCTLDATTTKPLSQYTAGTLQTSVAANVTTVRAKLNGTGYISINGTTRSQSNNTAAAVFNSVDANNNSRGELPGVVIAHPTRFILTCAPAAGATYATTTVSVDARTACQGEQ